VSRLVVNKYYRAIVEILSATVKHVRPHLRSVQIKFGKQGKFHFSRQSALEAIIPRETMIACHPKYIVHAARSPTFLWSFEPDSVKYLASVKWRAVIWQSDKGISSRRDKRRNSSTQCKHHISGSTQFYKVAARPASKHQRRSWAHITSYPDAESILRANPVDGGKQGSIQTTCNAILQRRNICERNVSVQQRSTGRHLASIASPPILINCVRNKIRKTIVSVANQVPFAASVAYTRSYLHSRWSTNQKRRYLSDSVRGTIKASCTRIRTYVESIAAISPSIVAHLEERKAKLEHYWAEYNDVQSRLESLDESEGCD